MAKSVKQLLRGVIMGAPGSGKGSLSEKIVERFDVIHLSTGDILRKNMKEGTEMGRAAKKFLVGGELVPDSLISDIVLDRLNFLKDKNFLLDGYPRTLSQAKKLHEAFPVNLFIHLHVSFDVIIERIKNRWVHVASGRVYNTNYKPPKVPGKDDVTGEPLIRRSDDNPETVKKRLEVYAATASPIIEFFKEKGVLREFRGDSTDEIWIKLEKVLEKFLNA